MARPRVNDDAVRAAIIAATTALLGVHRPDQVSVRQIAGAAGSSAAAIYTLFGSKDGLLVEVRAVAVASFGGALRAAPLSADPLADLRTLGQAYLSWARANPHLYGVLFGGLQVFDPSGPVAPSDPVAPLMAAVERGIAAGRLAGPPPDIAASLWVALHGIAGLERAGALHAEKAEGVLAATTQALLRGWARPRG